MIHHLDTNLFARRRIRFVRQEERSECGIAALAMVFNFHDRNASLTGLRERAGPITRGSTLKSLISLSEQLGYMARAVKVNAQHVDSLQMPAVLHWDLSHYVVIERVKQGKSFIHDPASGSRWLDANELSAHFTGIALELFPSTSLARFEAPPRVRLRDLWTQARGFKRTLSQLFALSLALQALVLATPYYMRICLDYVVPSLDYSLLTVVAVGFALIATFNAAITLVRSYVIAAASASLGFSLTVNVVRHAMRLPISWFEQRSVGDVISRVQSVGAVRQYISEGTVTTLVDGILLVTTFALMVTYSPLLTIICTGAVAIYYLFKVITTYRLRELQSEQIVHASAEQTHIIESIRGVRTIRTLGIEPDRLHSWQGLFVSSINSSTAAARVQSWQVAASTLLFGFEGVLSTWIAIRSVMAGTFTVGMIFAFFAFKGQFTSRASSLIDQIVSYQVVKLHLERLGDIAHTAQDFSLASVPGAARSLTGGIEFRNVSFRYGADQPYVIENLNLCVRPGEHIAITGASGCGKTTLLKLMLGLLMPSAGEILVDGQPLARIGFQAFRSQCAAVLQDDTLFSGSLRENICLGAPEMDEARMKLAAAQACLEETISALPMGYFTSVGDMGGVLSGGQKQRVLLARALYRDPKILILDEATSHLDSGAEQHVNRAIRHLGITRIAVAHRSETIANAERILTLMNGALHEGSGPEQAQVRNIDVGE